VRLLARLRARPAEPDSPGATLGFTDVLFAYVVGATLTASTAEDLSAASTAQLVLAGVVTLTSYVGYRNSAHRGRYRLRPFVNVPFWQLVVDVTLIYLYLLLTVRLDDPGAPSALPEAILLVVIALLYVMWDALAWALGRHPRYAEHPPLPDTWQRTQASVALCLLTLAVLIGVLVTQPRTTATVVAVDAALTLLIVAYRITKELVRDGA
jgi:L-asparagine transporter-like permease